MRKEDKENLYRLLRHHAEILGTARATMVALQSMIEVIKSLRCSKDNVDELYLEFADVVKNSEPKLVPMLRFIREFDLELKAYRNADLEERRTRAVRILEEKLKVYQESLQKLIQRGATSIEDGDVIVVHMASYILTNILREAKLYRNRNFRVIILQQLMTRSKELINALVGAGIEHTIVPTHDLAHYLETSNKLIVAAATITEDQKAMVPVGTANVVHSCHLHGIPAYLFASNFHFYDRSYEHLNIHEQHEMICEEDCQFRLTYHSHDLVAVDLFDQLITEDRVNKRQEPPFFRGAAGGQDLPDRVVEVSR